MQLPELMPDDFCPEIPEGPELQAAFDALVVLTEWNEFRALDLARLARTMRRPAMADLRNVYTRKEAEDAGLTYVAVGR